MHRPPLLPGNVPSTHFHWGLSRPQGHGAVGRNMSMKNPVTPPGIDPGTVRLVEQRINHYATPGLKNYVYIFFKIQYKWVCGNKLPTRCNRGFYCRSYCCSTCFGHHYSHHQELKSIIQWLLPVVFRAVVFKLLVWCGAEGYVSGLQDTAASCKPDT